MSLDNNKQLLDPSRWKGYLFNRQWIGANGGNLTVREPATGEVLAEVGQASATDVEVAVATAVTAQKSWVAVAPRERAAIFRRAANLLQTHFDEFIRRLAAKASHLPVGNPMTEQVALGPMISERQRDRAHAIIMDSIQAGAKLEAGGTYDRLFYKPTVLSNVKPGMRAYYEEVFDPCASVIIFKADVDAAVIANDTEYGLLAGIISTDVGRAMYGSARVPVQQCRLTAQLRGTLSIRFANFERLRGVGSQSAH